VTRRQIRQGAGLSLAGAGVVLAVVLSPYASRPLEYKNAKYRISALLPGDVEKTTESEEPARTDVCEGDTLHVTWVYPPHKQRDDSPAGLSLFTCRLRQDKTLSEFIRAEKVSIEARRGSTKSLGSGDLEVSTAGSVARLRVQASGRWLLMATVTSEESEHLASREAGMFLGTSRIAPDPKRK